MPSHFPSTRQSRKQRKNTESPRPNRQNPQTIFLTSPCLHLWCCTLGALLALDLLSLSPCGAGSGLSLLSLLLGLGGGLLLLALLDRLSTLSGASLGALAASLLDHIEGSTDDGTLVLDCAASALLRNFL